MTRLAAIYAGSNLMVAAVPFLLLPVLTRTLTPTSYGIVAMFGIAASVLNAIVGLNVHGAVTIRYFQLKPARLRRYVGACLTILAVSSALVVVVMLGIGGDLSKIAEVPRAWLLFAAVMSACQFVISLRLTLWQVRQQAWAYGALQIAQSLMNAGISLVLVVGVGLSWQGRTSAQVVTAVFVALIAAVSLYRERAVRFPPYQRDISDALKFGVPLVPHVLGGLMIAAADRAMVANLLSVADAGVYVVAAQVGMVLGLLTDAFNRAYAPWLLERLAAVDPARDIRIVRGTYGYFGMVLVLASAIGLLAPWGVPLLVGASFRDAANLVIYIALGYAFGGMYYMVTNYVFYAGRTVLLACITISAGLFNLIATYLLIRQNGLVGAAQGFMLSQAALFIGTWWLAQRARPMPWGAALHGWWAGAERPAGGDS